MENVLEKSVFIDGKSQLSTFFFFWYMQPQTVYIL